MKNRRPSLKKNKYVYSGMNHRSQKIQGEIESVSIYLAQSQLKQRGINSLTLSKKSIFSLVKYNKKISTTDIALFFRQLAVLVTADIPLLQSCNILQASQKSPTFVNLLEKIKAEIEAGNTLCTGLKKFPRYFDHLTCQLIQMGEHTGTLDTMLQRVAHNKEMVLRLKNKISQALFYPATVLIVAILITLIMIISVVPRFAELYQSLHSPLPAFTLGVINFSSFIRCYGWLAIPPLLGSFAFIYSSKGFVIYQKIIDPILLKLPGMKKIILARIARSLSITFSAGIPIIEALKLIATTSGNRVYAQAIFNLHLHIARGQQLHAAMQANTLFPPMVTQMVKIGEESGKLPDMLEKIADLYEADTDHLFTSLGHLLEPLIILVLGVLIGGLVIAMYLPIFKLGTVI